VATKLPTVNQTASSVLDLKVKTPKSPAGGICSGLRLRLRCNRSRLHKDSGATCFKEICNKN